MRIRILGSAAGGRFPQWNCACPHCEGVRSGSPLYRARTQDSIAVSAEGSDDWFVFNASPDLLQQIEQNDVLRPRKPRHTPIAGILLGNGDLDHVLGLFSLRESQPLVLYATDAVRRGLEEGNDIFHTLRRFPTQVTWKRLVLEETQPLLGQDGKPSGLSVRVFPVPGKRPVHLELARPGAVSAEDNVGFEILDTRKNQRCLYLSAAKSLADLGPRLEGADCLLFDGTFWTSDELIRLGLGTARAEDMAHWPLGGEGGSLAALNKLPVARKIYTHINNTNPILKEDSPEHRMVVEAGLEIATDGMEITL